MRLVGQGVWALMNKDEQLARAVWDWIISVNNGHGLDTSDLALALDELGAPCPEDMNDE